MLPLVIKIPPDFLAALSTHTNRLIAGSTSSSLILIQESFSKYVSRAYRQIYDTMSPDIPRLGDNCAISRQDP